MSTLDFCDRFSTHCHSFVWYIMSRADACFTVYLLLIASAPTIVAVIMSNVYDKESAACNESSEYLVDPQTYFYVAGAVQLGMSAIYFFTWIVLFKINKMGVWWFNNHCWFLYLMCIFACCPMLHLVWACIGIYIYAVQMRDQCKEDGIGIMMLVWCIIECVGTCCKVMMACYSYLVWLKTNEWYYSRHPQSLMPQVLASPSSYNTNVVNGVRKRIEQQRLCDKRLAIIGYCRQHNHDVLQDVYIVHQINEFLNESIPSFQTYTFPK
eukprot:254306_1